MMQALWHGALSSHQKTVVHWGHKGMDMGSSSTQAGSCGAWKRLPWYKGAQSVPRKDPPHHYNSTSTDSQNHWHKTGWIPAFLFIPNSDPLIRIWQLKLRLKRPGGLFCSSNNHATFKTHWAPPRCWCSMWSPASCLDHVFKTKHIQLQPCHWSIGFLCPIKWPVSVPYVHIIQMTFPYLSS